MVGKRDRNMIERGLHTWLACLVTETSERGTLHRQLAHEGTKSQGTSRHRFPWHRNWSCGVAVARDNTAGMNGTKPVCDDDGKSTAM